LISDAAGLTRPQLGEAYYWGWYSIADELPVLPPHGSYVTIAPGTPHRIYAGSNGTILIRRNK